MRYDFTTIRLHEPRQPQRDRDDDDQLDELDEMADGSRVTRREPQLDPLGALLALGRSGHGLG